MSGFVLLLAGCDEGLLYGGPLLELETLAAATAVRVGFTGPHGEAVQVELSDDDGPIVATEWWEGADLHTQTLIGVPAATALTGTLLNRDGDVLATATVTTPALPASIPEITLSGTPGWTGYLATSLLGETPAAVILDERGRVVFYAEETEPGQLFRVRLRHDGLGIYWLFVPDDPGEIGARFVTMDWADDHGRAAILDQAVTHDFVELDDGSVGLIGDDVREVGGSSVSGNTILEWDGSSVTEVWNSLDAFADDDGGIRDDTVWTHANALVYDEEDDAWQLGLRTLSAIVEIDRASGVITDQLGGEASTWSFADDAAFLHQHQFVFTADAVIVHDNRDAAAGSRVIELDLDATTRIASLTRSFVHDPPLYVFAMGDVDRATDGSTLVTWSSAGVIDDFDDNGAIRASLSTEFGAAFGFTERFSTIPGQVRLR